MKITNLKGKEACVTTGGGDKLKNNPTGGKEEAILGNSQAHGPSSRYVGSWDSKLGRMRWKRLEMGCTKSNWLGILQPRPIFPKLHLEALLWKTRVPQVNHNTVYLKQYMRGALFLCKDTLQKILALHRKE